MKKAKNVFAIIAIVFGVVAAILAVGLPFIDGLLAKIPYGDAFANIGPHFNNMFNNLKELFTFGWFGEISSHILELGILIAGGIGLVLFIVLLVLMCCKKHVKGLGWWFPMLIIFVVSVAVVGGNKLNNAGYDTKSFVEVAYIGNAGTYVAMAAGALFILSVIFYMVYVCKARKNQKKADSARQAAIAKIDALLGGNK
ncbi:MAG: hypothetical protein KBS97_01025 [Firmicutes bacterium]|nr:hypothetical protein [Candidatus Fiminaster equi]